MAGLAVGAALGGPDVSPAAPGAAKAPAAEQACVVDRERGPKRARKADAARPEGSGSLEVRRPCPEPRLSPVRGVEGRTRARIGIADQTDAAFDDERFRRLGLRFARRSVGWDAMQHAWQVDDIDDWLRAARRRGVQPLVTFARSRIAARRHTLPTPAQFELAFRAFRARFPGVRAYSAWNEANHCGEAKACRRPDRVAGFYKAIKRNCAGCKVLAADLLDMPNMVEWVLRFKKAAGEEPRYWGLHNYVSANRFDVGATTALLQYTTGEVWLTETGGLVARRNASPIELRQGAGHAVRVTRFIFDTLARLSPRVSRVYLYHWKSATPDDTWDSGLVGPDGRSRPALGVLQAVVASRRGRSPAGR